MTRRKADFSPRSTKIRLPGKRLKEVIEPVRIVHIHIGVTPGFTSRHF